MYNIDTDDDRQNKAIFGRWCWKKDNQ